VTVPVLLDEPYPGLRSFRRDETHIFFGRETCINDMVQRLGVHRFLAVTGSSGSGKSSLVRTGLLDALDRGLLAAAGADWRFADFRPGNDPLAELAQALIATIGSPASEQERLRVEAILARGPLGLVEWIESTDLSPDASLLVLADQFEEIFRYRRGRTGDDINAFVALLLASAAQRRRPVYVVITMRSDFLGECSQFTGLAEAINDGQYLTPRLTREQCKSAIEGPAAVFGGRVESALTNRLLNDMGTNADQLPLAQHALMRMWRIAAARTGPDARVLKLEDYEKLGGIGSAAIADGMVPGGQVNALSAHADEILSELSPEQQRLASIVFRALTERHGAGGRDVRRPIALGEAAAIAGVAPEQLVPVIDAFRAPGRNLLTPPSTVPLTAETVVDISHESLIRQWGTLGEWLREESDAARIYLHVEANAKLWREGNSGLMPMPFLGIARAWREREQPNASWAKRYGDEFALAMEFLDKSLAAERQRIEAEEAARRRSMLRSRTVAAAMAVLAIIALGFGYFAEQNASEARNAAARAEQSAKEAEIANASALKGQSNYLAERASESFANGDFLRSMLFAVEALPDQKHNVTRPEVQHAREMLARTYLQVATQGSPVVHSATVTYLRFLPPGDRLLSASQDGTARIWDLDGQPILAMDGHLGSVTGVDATPDGNTIATASVDGVARIWDAGSGRLLAQLVTTSQLNGVAIRNDGKAAVTVGADGSALVWDVATASKSAVLQGHGKPLNSAAFSPDASQLLILSESAAQLWDAQSNKLLKEISFTEPVAQAAYSLDGSRLAVFGKYATAEVWDARALRRIVSLKLSCCNDVMALSPDGSLLAIANGYLDGQTLQAVDVSTSKTTWSTTAPLSQSVKDLAFSPDGTTLIAGSSDGSLRVWDARAGKQIAATKLASGAHPFAVSPDSKRVAAFTVRGQPIVWTIGGKPPSGAVADSLALSGNGRQFLLLQPGGPATVWDASAKKILGRLLASNSAAVGAFDPKGQRIAVLSADNVIGIWTDNDLQHTADIPDIAVTGIAFSPDGQVLAASASSTQFDAFDAGAGVHSSDPTQGLSGVGIARLSPDGKRLFLAGGVTPGQLWDVTSGHVIARIAGTGWEGGVFSSDSKRLITRTQDGAVTLFDADTGAQLAVLLTDGTQIASNEREDRMATLSGAGQVIIWETSSGKMLLQAANAADHIIMGARSDRLMAWSDTRLDVLDARAGGEIATINTGGSSQILYPQITDDGSRVMFENGTKVAIWDATKAQQICVLAGTWSHTNEISEWPNRDGSRVVVKDDKGAIDLFDGTSGSLIATLDPAFTDNGAVVLAPDGTRLLLARSDGRIDLWDISDAKHLATLSDAGVDHRLDFAISNDSSRIVTATNGPVVRVWNARTGEHVADLAGLTANAQSVYVSPDSGRIVTVSADGVLFIWDAKSNAKVAEFDTPQSGRSVLFSADGNHIVSVRQAQQTDLFDVGTGRAMRTVAGNAVDLASAFSATGQRLVTASGKTATVWDLTNGNQVSMLTGHSDTITGAMFSPDEKEILTFADDKTVRLWSAATGASIAVLGGDASPLAKGRFSPNGAYVVTLSPDGQAQLWRAADGSTVTALGAAAQYATVIFPPGGSSVALFSTNAMSTYDLSNPQAGEQATMSIRLLDGYQVRGLNYVDKPFGDLAGSNDSSVLKSGLELWSMPWSTQDYVDTAQAMLPRCFTKDERLAADLDPTPPDWCVEMAKWPYNTAAWKQWLADKAAGKDVPLPQDQ
jgi:WD40 repeat protein